MKIFFFLVILFAPFSSYASNSECPGVDAPPTPVLKVDLNRLLSNLENLKNIQGQKIWQTNDQTKAGLKEIFESVPQKTKLEQFFQLLFLIQNNLEPSFFPLKVTSGIREVLLTARVFTDPSFPQTITGVELIRKDSQLPPTYRVQFSKKEVRFPINRGKGFAVFDHGMCQTARELIFYPGFSFRLRKAGNGNLIANNFNGVEIYGNFGSRGIISVDLNYTALEKVEFIKGTDEGKIKARVAKREFKENPHSAFFKFIGSLIPDTSRQRIDW